MAPFARTGTTLAGVSALAVGAAVLAVLGAVEYAICQVGTKSGGFRTTIHMDVPEWNAVGGACFVGKANSLVVEPGLNMEPGTIQPLTARGPDAQLCSWLSRRVEEHRALRDTWEKERKVARSKLRWWQLFRRFGLWNAVFPPPRLQATVKFVDLALGGGPESSLPWISAVFSYVPPSPYTYYDFGVFNHLRGSFSSVPGVQEKEVLLLLNPHHTFNKVVPDSLQGEVFDPTEIFSLLGGEYFGGSRADWHIHWTSGVDGGPALDLYVKDFWNIDGDCLVKSRFVVQFGGDALGTPCDLLRRQGRYFPLAYLSNTVPVMRVSLDNANFFDNVLPGFTGRVTSSLVRDTRGASFSWPSKLVLGILTDPALASRYSRAATILSSHRWAQSLAAHFSRKL